MTQSSDSTADVSQDLLEILVCPIDKAKIELNGNSLVCSVCGRIYPIENGIPNMLAEDED
jgi:uncharacterized protein YbaR (Trm112 family)